ncbi:MAG: HupE/UreJ family protein [Pseudomonadota bacterium]
MMVSRRVLPLFALCLFGLLAWSEARAHFLLNVNVRIIIVEHLDDGLRVYLRLSMPYLVADKIGAEQADGTVEAAPYTTNRIEEGQLMHLLDKAAYSEDPTGLGRLVADGHHITVEGRELPAEVEVVRAYPAIAQPPFANLAEAQRAFEASALWDEAWGESFVGDTVVDVVLRYRTDGPVHDYDFSSSLNPGLEGQEEQANLLLDTHPGSDPIITRVRGLLDEPVAISRSAWAAAYTFFLEGGRHILEGLDHVLFVLCLTIGASGLSNLLWRVTGFTLGHSVTLILGFFGYVPSGAWFIPTVESGIALSIIYAGVIAVMNKPSAGTFLVTTLIGLLHGLGFSFVLHEILKVDSPNLWHSLVAFNLGVEAGQVLIVLAIYPVIVLLRRKSLQALSIGRWIVATPCIAVAAFWTGQRVNQILEVFWPSGQA